MKIFLLALLLPVSAFAQAPDLTVTLPTGKVITFQTADQKSKYQAAAAASKAKADDVERRIRLDTVETAKRQRTEEDLADALAKKRMDIFVTIFDFKAQWIVGSVSLAVKHLDPVTWIVTWDDGGSLPGTAYIEWKPPATALNMETYRIEGYECGFVEVNGERRRRITTSKERAAKFMTDPAGVKWPPID